MKRAYAAIYGPDPPVDTKDNPISVLLLAAKWQFDTLGISTVNRSLVNNLRLLDPVAKKINITCAISEEEGKIADDQLKDAEKHGVLLRGAKQPRGPKKKPKLKWLDQSTAKYYHQLLMEHSYDYVIGHAPYLANGCFNFRDICKIRGNNPKIILIFHGLPKNSEGDVDEEYLLDWLKEANVVFSLGGVLQSEITPYITSLEPEHRPAHKMYIPTYPLELFNMQRDIVKGKKPEVTQNITIMTAEKNNLEVSGLDLPLAVGSTAAASEYIGLSSGIRTNLVMLAARKEDTELWKQNFKEILEENKIRQKGLNFQCSTTENIEKLKSHMRKSNLFLFPSKFDSPCFGTETLAAVAAGVPILVSKHSGITSLLSKMVEDDTSVHDIFGESDVETWKERIIQKIMNPKEAQSQASRLREQLLLDVSIASTHLDFINIIVGMYTQAYFKFIKGHDYLSVV